MRSQVAGHVRRCGDPPGDAGIPEEMRAWVAVDTEGVWKVCLAGRTGAHTAPRPFARWFAGGMLPG